jgi:hypothetical protein
METATEVPGETPEMRCLSVAAETAAGLPAEVPGATDAARPEPPMVPVLVSRPAAGYSRRTAER